MNNKSILLIDPEFDPKDSESLNLLVKIGVDSFSYAIIDEEQKMLYAVYDEQECKVGYKKLNERLKIDSYLTLAYKNVKIAAHTQNVVFVPNELFNEEITKLSSRYFTATDSESVYVQTSEKNAFTTILSLPKTAEAAINQYWPKSNKLPENAGLLNLAALFLKNTLVLDFTVKSFQALYIREKEVVFQQSYEFEDVEELTYYLLLIISQLQIEAKVTAVKVCGIIHIGDDKLARLKNYFDDVDFLTVNTGLNTTILDDMPKHYYTNLLSLHTCV